MRADWIESLIRFLEVDGRSLDATLKQAKLKQKDQIPVRIGAFAGERGCGGLASSINSNETYRFLRPLNHQVER
jgi:hypothetical protein